MLSLFVAVPQHTGSHSLGQGPRHPGAVVPIRAVQLYHDDTQKTKGLGQGPRCQGAVVTYMGGAVVRRHRLEEEAEEEAKEKQGGAGGGRKEGGGGTRRNHTISVLTVGKIG